MLTDTHCKEKHSKERNYTLTQWCWAKGTGLGCNETWTRFQSVPCIEPRGFSWSTQCRHTAQSRLWIVPQTWVHTDCLYCWAIPPEVGISSNHPKDCPAHLLHGRGTLNRTTSSDFLPTWGTRQFLYALKFHSRYMGHPGCSRQNSLLRCFL